MLRILIAASLTLSLCACESEQEHRAKWIAWCIEGEFSAKQCVVLYSLAKASSDAESAANSAAIFSGVSMGMAAGSMSTRR